ILGRPTLAALGAVPSMIHLKMKYHNDEDEVVTIEANMVGAKRCHQGMQKATNTTAGGRNDKSTSVNTPTVKENGKQPNEVAPMEIIPNKKHNG
ncbi:hypothetical protein A2U01_0076447, partial [Trifolium medium]|nr:hypothetical protein [Trifolium medium]